MKKILILLFVYPFIVVSGQDADYFSPIWRLNFSGGVGYLLPNYSSDKKAMEEFGFDKQEVDDYYKDFKLGVQGNTDLHYLLHRNWGIGLRYSFFSSSAEEEKRYTFSHVSGYSDFRLGAEETMYINYVGPSFHLRFFIDEEEKLMISSTFSIGYAHYRDEAKINGLGYSAGTLYPDDSSSIPILSTANSLGFDMNVGMEYFLSEKLSLGLDVGLFYSSFGEFKIKGLGQNLDFNDDEIDVSRINISLGIRTYF